MLIDPRNIELPDADMIELLRRSSGTQRVQSMFDLMEFGRDVVLSAVRAQYPIWTHEQVRQEAMWRLFGEASGITAPRR